MKLKLQSEEDEKEQREKLGMSAQFVNVKKRLICIVFMSLSVLFCWGHAVSAEERIQNLINQLSIEVDFDTSSQAHEKLILMGKKSFPVLMENIQNEKEAHPQFGGARLGPISIGLICLEIIRHQVEHFYRGYQPEYLDYGNIHEWWENNKGRALRDLRIDALKWKINEVQTNAQWQEGKTWHLEQLWQACKKLNALDACGLKQGILNIKASLISVDSGHIKASLSNTGTGPVTLVLGQKHLFTGNVNDAKSGSIKYTVNYSTSRPHNETLTILPSTTQDITLVPSEVDGYGKDVLWKEIPQGTYRLVVYYTNQDGSGGSWTGSVYSELKFKK